VRSFSAHHACRRSRSVVATCRATASVETSCGAGSTSAASAAQETQSREPAQKTRGLRMAHHSRAECKRRAGGGVLDGCRHQSLRTMNVNAANMLPLGHRLSYQTIVLSGETRRIWYSVALRESAPGEMSTHTGRTDRAVRARPTSHPEHGPLVTCRQLARCRARGTRGTRGRVRCIRDHELHQALARTLKASPVTDRRLGTTRQATGRGRGIPCTGRRLNGPAERASSAVASSA
jgi:hypothetical protein